MKPVYLIESAERGTEDWNSCWWDVYYSNQEGIADLKNLRKSSNGFTKDYKYRVRRYIRWESRNDQQTKDD